MYACFHSVGLHERPLSEAIGIVADANYSALELNAETLPWAAPHITPEADMDERRAVKEACAARGLKIAAIGAKIGMVDEDPSRRATAIAFVKGCIDLAVDVGAPFVHTLSGPQGTSTSRADSWRWLAEAIEKTADYAQEKHIELGIEAIAGHLFRSVDDYHQLYADLPGIPFMVNFDPSHLVVQGEDARRVPDELGDRIRHVHLKDGKGRYPDFAFPPLGEGLIDFSDLVSRLRAVGYSGALSVEYEAQVYGYSRSETEIVMNEKAFCDRLGIADGALALG